MYLIKAILCLWSAGSVPDRSRAARPDLELHAGDVRPDQPLLDGLHAQHDRVPSHRVSQSHVIE